MSSKLTVAEAASQRRSIRKYTSETISKETLDEIIRVSGLAPSPWNFQPWRVIVATSQEDKDKIKEAAYGQPQVGNAAAVFVIYTDMEDVLKTMVETVHPGYGDKREETAKSQVEMFEKMSLEDRATWGCKQGYTFMGYLLLVAQSMGYSTSAMLGFEPDKLRELYELPEYIQFPAIVAMGVGAEEGFPHHRHSVDRLATFL